MQVIYKRASVLLGFAVLVIVVVVNAWLIERQLDSQVEDHALLVHSERVLLELTQTGLLLDDAETGQRGFLYTGRPDYLEPYNRATAEIDQHLGALAKLTADDPYQLENQLLLTNLAHEKLAELKETVGLYTDGKPEESRQLVLSGKGKATMDQVRRSIADMEQEEQALADRRSAEYWRGVRRNRAVILAATAVTILGLAMLSYYILRELSLRERAAEEVRAREEWYRVTLTSIGDAVIATDPGGIVTFLNPIAEDLTGISLSKAKGRPVDDIFPIFNEHTRLPVENPVAKVLADGRIVGLANHTVLKHVDGSFTPIEDSAAPIRDDRQKLIGVVLVFRDATPAKEAEEIVRRAEKLAAAARLASTVAHEINNPLDAVGNLVFLAKTVPDLPPAAFEYLTVVEDQLERVFHITKQTLAFYRESGKWETVDLSLLVDSALNLYSNKLDAKHIAVQRDFVQCPTLCGSPGELKQVISNLLSNAADAVAENGRVTVKVAPCTVSGQDGVLLRIEDDGPGIPSENLAKIFEPFFTTKQDVGTGLGLWVTKEIVKRHGGSIQADSGRTNSLPGAAFTVCLPIESGGPGGSDGMV